MKNSGIEPAASPVASPVDDDCIQAEAERAVPLDRGSLDRILGNLRGHLETLVDHRPLDALALSLVVQAADNIRTASRTADRVLRENAESARRRAALERFRTADDLQRRLAVAPGLALAEAKFSQDGARAVIALWRSLGESLSGSEGWNDEELSLARALTGSSHPSLKTTRERVRLEQALDRDRQKPLADLVSTVDRVMHGYVDRLAAILGTMGIDSRNLHEIVIETVQDKAFELSNMIGADDREAIARYRERTQALYSGRLRWATARAFVAGQIRAWKSIRNRRAAIDDQNEAETSLESLSTAEMRKADWARKNLSAAIADFQKTLALGKSIGLPEVICPKPPKPGKQTGAAEKRTNVCTDESETRKQSIRSAFEPIVKAARPVTQSHEAKIANHRTIETDAETTRRHADDRICSNQPTGISLPRDARGRFVAGAVVRQPRDARGRFRKSDSKAGGSNQVLQTSASSGTFRTLTRSLRPTSKGLDHLRTVVPNVTGREQASLCGKGGSCESPAGCGEVPGGAKSLADFAENVQNDGMNRMPGSDQVKESRSDLPPDTERGVAGDGER